jgi:outer membrane lipoprotein-sorting protein
MLILALVFVAIPLFAGDIAAAVLGAAEAIYNGIQNLKTTVEETVEYEYEEKEVA